MKKKGVVLLMFVGVVLLFCACGKSSESPAGDSAPVSTPAKSEAVAVPAQSGLQKISDFADAWNKLYKQNEAVINSYEGMPIIGLVTPALTFVTSAQFDILNLNNQDGRFEGKLMLAGYKGFVEKAGATITFGYDDTLEKDGFGPAAKAGDRQVAKGSLALDKGHYLCETYSERGGKKIIRSTTEMIRLGDGSMICLAFSGRTTNMKGDEGLSDDVIYVHNGKNQYDFVIAKAKTGPEFKTIPLAEQGELTKEKAIELFKAAGYIIDQSGGIVDGKLVVDK